MTLLRAIRRALPADGTLLIAEPISGVRGAEPIGDAYFAFYLLAMGSGRPRTFATAHGNAAARPASPISHCGRPAMPMLTSVITHKAG